MGTLIILAAAILGGLACAKQTLYQSWIFLVNLVFSVYLAVMLAPLIHELLLPSLNPGKEMDAYLLSGTMLALFLILMIAFYKITDAVITIDFDDYPIPAPVNKIGAMVFAAFSGAVLAAFLLACVSLMPLVQYLPLDRVALADSGRNMLSAMVHTVNVFSLQGTSEEAAKTLNSLTAYQPSLSSNSGAEKKTESVQEDIAALPETVADKIVGKKRQEKIDGKVVEPAGPQPSKVRLRRTEQIEKIDGKVVEPAEPQPSKVRVRRTEQIEKIDGKAVNTAEE